MMLDVFNSGRYLGISWQEALSVVLTTTALYLFIVILVRLLGQRVLTSHTSLDIVAVLTLGSITARSILGEATTLAGGLLAISTVLGIQALLSVVRRWHFSHSLVVATPQVLVLHGRVLHDTLRSTHLTETDIWARMRQSGVTSPDEVAYMILESNGAISVLREGKPIDPRLLAGVPGAVDETAAESTEEPSGTDAQPTQCEGGSPSSRESEA